MERLGFLQAKERPVQSMPHRPFNSHSAERLEMRQGFQHLFRMFSWLHRIEPTDDLAIRADQHGNPCRAGRVVIRCAIGDGHCFIRVRQQVEREIKLVLKGLVVFGRIEAAAYHNDFI